MNKKLLLDNVKICKRPSAILEKKQPNGPLYPPPPPLCPPQPFLFAPLSHLISAWLKSPVRSSCSNSGSRSSTRSWITSAMIAERHNPPELLSPTTREGNGHRLPRSGQNVRTCWRHERPKSRLFRFRRLHHWTGLPGSCCRCRPLVADCEVAANTSSTLVLEVWSWGAGLRWGRR